MSRPWPSSPLDAAQRAFDLLTCPPAPLAFDGRGFAGLPPRLLPLDELKKILIADRTPRPVRDTVWREVVVRGRRDGPAWVVAAVGLAIPGLRRAAGKLAAGWRGDTADLDGELLAGFVDRLHTVDVDGPRVCGRLVDAGIRAVRRARARVEDTDAVHVEGAWSLPPAQPWDHPDWVLARAVAAAVIDPDDHLLISATRLDEVPLQQVADRLGVSVTVAAGWRRRAEARLAQVIRDGELAWVPLARQKPAGAAVRRPARAAGSSYAPHVAPGSAGSAPRLDPPERITGGHRPVSAAAAGRNRPARRPPG